MKSVIFFTGALITFSLLISCSSEKKNINSLEPSNSVSQTDLNLSSEAIFIITKNKLDSIITIIQKEYDNDSTLIINLSNSQKEWLEYRDAQLLMKFPMNDPIREGSVFNTCYFDYINELTKERIDILNDWIEGVKEGEVCGGSIKIKGTE